MNDGGDDKKSTVALSKLSSSHKSRKHGLNGHVGVIKAQLVMWFNWGADPKGEQFEGS